MTVSLEVGLLTYYHFHFQTFSLMMSNGIDRKSK